VQYSNDNIKVWATDLNKSSKWIKSALDWMISKGWITVNSKRKSYRIISYNQLHRKLRLTTMSGVVFEEDDFSNFKVFCNAALIDYVIRVKKYSDKKNKRSVSSMGGTSMNHNISFPRGFYPMPISYLAAYLNISTTTAFNMKKSAREHNYISVKYQAEKLEFIKSKSDLLNYLKSYPDNKPYIRKRGRNEYVYISADLIKSDLFIKRKRLKN
jgi:hypothetical protein